MLVAEMDLSAEENIVVMWALELYHLEVDGLSSLWALPSSRGVRGITHVSAALYVRSKLLFEAFPNSKCDSQSAIVSVPVVVVAIVRQGSAGYQVLGFVSFTSLWSCS